jgi:hypothetical protein
MTCQHTMTLGVYLLGALEPAERSAFESHLSYCEICRGELVRLAPLPGLLNQISPEDFADSMPPTGAEGAVATHAYPITEPVPLPLPLMPEPRPEPEPVPPDERPRNRPGNKLPGGPGRTSMPRRFWRTAAVFVAVVAVAVGGIFGWQAFRGETGAPPPQADGVVWTGHSADGTATVEARLVDHEWGTEFQMKFHGMPPDRECYLKVYDHYGRYQVAGWWGTDHDPNDMIPGSVAMRRSKIDKLEFLLDDKETIAITVEAPH